MTGTKNSITDLDPVLSRLASEIVQFEGEVADLPVTPKVTPSEIRANLERFDFAAPVPLEALIGDVAELLRRWSLHVNHPRYFGLFNPTVRRAGVVADALVALYNPQLAAWPHAPIANEIERHVLAWFMRSLGRLPPRRGHSDRGRDRDRPHGDRLARTPAGCLASRAGGSAVDGWMMMPGIRQEDDRR